jgi:hypothetical protein
MYKVYLDQNKTFECDIKIEGADSSKSEARLVLETKDFFITFKGSIQDGKVKIPINKLKGVLKENYQGNMSLEVIAEDTFFIPWKDTFETDTLRKVEVSFNDDSKLIKETNTKTPTKPTVASAAGYYLPSNHNCNLVCCISWYAHRAGRCFYLSLSRSLASSYRATTRS